LGELYFGAYGSPTRKDAALKDITADTATVTVLPSDAMTAEIYGCFEQDLKR
jgi:predicted nucleic acid-binding protein